jgi:hypothetical protein
MSNETPGLYWADALRMIRPIIDSEIDRGNYGQMSRGDARDSREAWVFHYRIDIAAVTAQFDFGEGILALGDPSAPGVITFRGSDERDAFIIAGGKRARSWLARRRQAAWWQKWRAGARAPERFENPFATLAA